MDGWMCHIGCRWYSITARSQVLFWGSSNTSFFFLSFPPPKQQCHSHPGGHFGLMFTGPSGADLSLRRATITACVCICVEASGYTKRKPPQASTGNRKQIGGLNAVPVFLWDLLTLCICVFVCQSIAVCLLKLLWQSGFHFLKDDFFCPRPTCFPLLSVSAPSPEETVACRCLFVLCSPKIEL